MNARQEALEGLKSCVIALSVNRLTLYQDVDKSSRLFEKVKKIKHDIAQLSSEDRFLLDKEYGVWFFEKFKDELLEITGK